MNSKTFIKAAKHDRRHARIRAKVSGTAARPRLAIYKSNRYMHAQIIDDTAGKTIVAGSTKDLSKGAKKMDAAKALGTELAKRAKAAGITAVVFDRGGFRYTGRVSTLADAAREGGLNF
jgi:large subunit ribosomal protein L18